eukprot:jgi/Mesvir1/25997/Mv20964-RA.1
MPLVDPLAATTAAKSVRDAPALTLKGLLDSDHDVARIILAAIPLMDRVRLWLLFPGTFRDPVGASFAEQKVVDEETYGCGDRQLNGDALLWLLPKCPKLETLNTGRWVLKGEASVDGVLTTAAACCGSLRRVVTCNHATDQGVVALAQGCKGLRQLGLSGCSGVTDASLMAVAHGCPLLEWLEVDGCYLVTDAGIEAIAEHCTQLSHLDAFTGCDVGDRGILAVANFSRGLKFLDVHECMRVGDDEVLAIAHGCPLLETFVFSGQATDVGVNAVLRHCLHLTSLVISTSDYTDAAFRDLGDGCRELTVLEVFRANHGPDNDGRRDDDDAVPRRITDRGIISLARHCRDLTTIEISDPRVGTNACISALAASSPHLTSLNLKGLDVTDAGISSLPQHCPTLAQLALRGCPEITDEGLSRILVRLTKLEGLDLLGTCLGNKTLLALGGNCPRLVEMIGLGSDDDDVDDQGVAALLRGCPRLRALSMRGCSKVTGGAFAMPGVAPRELRKLDVTKCTSFTSLGFVAMAAKCPELISLNACSCPGLTDNAIEEVVRGCGKLKHIGMVNCTSVTADGLAFVLTTAKVMRDIDTDHQVVDDVKRAYEDCGFKKKDMGWYR